MSSYITISVRTQIIIKVCVSQKSEDHFTDPSISQYLSVSVHNNQRRARSLSQAFPSCSAVAPEIKTTTKRIAQSRGRETILECVVIAFPHAVSYWQKNGLRIKNSLKYRIEAYDEGYHTLTLSLRIFITESGDYGEYQCVAANSLGSDEGVVNLYGKLTTSR